MFTLVVWLIVIALGVWFLYRTIRKGNIESSDLLQLFGIAVGVLVALYSMNNQPLSGDGEPKPRPTPLSLSTIITSTPSPTQLEKESTATVIPSPTSTETGLPEATSTATVSPEPTSTTTDTPQPTPTNSATSLPTFESTATLTPAPPIATSTSTPAPTATLTVTATGSVSQPAQIVVMGIGTVGDNVTNSALRERNALLAAELDAKRQLVAWAAGENIESVTVTELGTLTSDTIKQIIQAKVPPYKVVEKRYDATTSTGYVTLELDIAVEE